MNIHNLQTLIIPEDHSPSQNYAAGEFISYFKKLTGLDLEKRVINDGNFKNSIILGDHPAIPRISRDIMLEDLKDENFYIQVLDDNIIIAGSKLRGAIYGTYTFLDEYLGIKFLAPEIVHIPKEPTQIHLEPSLKEYSPAFPYRVITYLDALDPEFSPTQKINLNPFAEPEMGGSHKFSTTKMTHTFYSLVPPKKYFKDHPEYFSLVDGERIQQLGQLCLTNPDVKRIATDTVLRWFEEEPEILTVGIVQNDWTGYCECETCRAVDRGNPARTLLYFCKHIANAVKERYPEKFIHTIAYTYTENYPDGWTEQLPNNLIIVACNMYPYRSNKPIDGDPMNDRYYNNLKGWLDIAPHVFVWHYFVDFTHYLMPYPIWSTMASDLKKYRDLGIEGVLLQAGIGLGLYQEFQELKWYVFHKLLWNPDLNLNNLIQDFVSAYYSESKETVLEYIEELMEIEQNEDVSLHLYVGLEGNHIEKEWVIKWQNRFKQELENIKQREEPQLQERLEKILMGLDYAYLLIPTDFNVLLGKIVPTDFDYRKIILERFTTATKRFKVTTHGEQVPLRAFLDRQEYITRENSVLGMAELAPLVYKIMRALYEKVKEESDENNYFVENNFITSALKLGLQPLELGNWMTAKQVALYRPGVPDNWHRWLNEKVAEKLFYPELPNVKSSDLPSIVLNMIKGLPSQVDSLEE
mgnify:CR=1 FL=1